MDFGLVKSLSIAGKAVKTLLLDGRLVWKKAEPGPAYDYEVEYVETDGALSYMDIGIVPDVRTSYEIDLTYVGGSYSGTSTIRNCAYGCATSTTTASASHVLYSKPQDGFVKFAKPTSNLFTEAVPGVRFKVSVSAAVDGKSSISIGDHVETVTNNYTVGTTMKFGCSYTGSSDFYATAKFHGAKFWQDGVLVRDLVPVVKDGDAGLYDRVGDVFYGNASGAGSIAAGPKVGGEAYVHTKGLSDSFWSVPATELGCVVPPPEPCQFGIEADIMIDDDYLPDGQSYASFGFALTNSLFPNNVRSYTADGVTVVRAYGLGSVVTATVPCLVIPTGERHVVNWDADPVDKKLSLVSLDGTVALSGVSNTAKYPVGATSSFASNITIGGIAKPDGSVSYAGRMRIYRLKVWQFGNLLADLVPYKDGSDVGMMDKLSGKKFPGSNLEYGEL